MSVICFASLKGGVGKTSLAINVAHAFAERDCRTLVIDFDPSAHTTRFFGRSPLPARGVAELKPRPKREPKLTVASAVGATASTSKIAANLPASARDIPFVRLLLAEDNTEGELENLLAGDNNGDGIICEARENLDYIAGGGELRHLLLGRGANLFARRFPAIIEELNDVYDYVIVDTCPDFNLLTRNSLAVADLAVVPVDPSEMSIFSLEELLRSSQHIRRPTWVVLRTMVNKKAQRTSSLSTERLGRHLAFTSVSAEEEDEQEDFDIENPQDFMRMLQHWERENPPAVQSKTKSDSPIYLLRSLVYRTEQQNQLSFLGKTAFDTRATSALADQYLSVARELESLISPDSEGGSLTPYSASAEEESDGAEPHFASA
ncbi:MAG: AAA family ATPase [Deltaproteobacteria bacterium]|nr:AAA family ATPase [Deltaproteobacteria bacterium]